MQRTRRQSLRSFLLAAELDIVRPHEGKLKALLLAFAMAAVGASQGSSPRALVVSLEPSQSKAARAGPVWLVVTVRNATAAQSTLTGISAIVLTDRAGASWWAPFDFGSQAPVGPNTRSTLATPAGTASTARINLAALHWAKAISAVWPYGSLNETLPAGHYRAQFTFDGPGNPKVHLKSQQASIVLK